MQAECDRLIRNASVSQPVYDKYKIVTDEFSFPILHHYLRFGCSLTGLCPRIAIT